MITQEIMDMAEELIQPHLKDLEDAIVRFSDSYCIVLDFHPDKETLELFKGYCISATNGNVLKSNIAEDITFDTKKDGRFIHQLFHISLITNPITKSNTIRVIIAVDNKSLTLAHLMASSPSGYELKVIPSKTQHRVISLHVKEISND